MPGAYSARFAESPRSRVIVTTLSGETVTFLDQLAFNLRATHTLNAPFEISFTVPSDHPEVNLPAGASSDQPFVEEGLNLVYWFLRFGEALIDTPGQVYECMGAGVILNIEDSSDSNSAPVSAITAFDSWKLLYKAPCLDEDGEIRHVNHFATGSRASDIVNTLLERLAYYRPDFDARLDLTGGTLEDTVPLETPFEIVAGTSIGEAFDNLVTTGTIDIWMEPIYDPVGNPGDLCRLNIYQRKGTHQPEAVMAWDRWPRSLVGINRSQDGTQRANYLRYYAGQGGPPVDDFSDTQSINRYGEYWEQEDWPADQREVVVEARAHRELLMRKNGLFGYQISPAAERSPVPFKEYTLGDTVPVYASKRLRRPIETNRLRVHSIPVVVEQDQFMRIEQLEVSADTSLALWCEAGEDYYAEALAHNEEFAVPEPWQTTLTAPQETDFLAWLSNEDVPWAPGDLEYDMRGYWLAAGGTATTPPYTFDPEFGAIQFPVDYDTPYSTHFSETSVYALPGTPFEWEASILIDTRDNSVVFGPCNGG